MDKLMTFERLPSGWALRLGIRAGWWSSAASPTASWAAMCASILTTWPSRWLPTT